VLLKIIQVKRILLTKTGAMFCFNTIHPKNFLAQPDYNNFAIRNFLKVYL